MQTIRCLPVMCRACNPTRINRQSAPSLTRQPAPCRQHKHRSPALRPFQTLTKVLTRSFPETAGLEPDAPVPLNLKNEFRRKPMIPFIQRFLRNEYRFLHKPLNLTSRVLILFAAIAVGASLFFPLWHLHLVAPQYQEGLNLYIHAYKIRGGGIGGNDLNEINNLNHYIGMKPIQQADFTEMQVMPFMFGVFILLALRAMVFGE